MRKSAVIGGVIALVMMGAAFGSTSIPPAAAVAVPGQVDVGPVTRLSDCQPILTRLPKPRVFTVGPPGSIPAVTSAPAVTPAPAVPVEATPSFSDAGASSTTNVQVAGVDEPDLVETDGRYLYSTVRGDLRVVDLTSRREVAAVRFPWQPARSDAVSITPDLGEQLLLVDHDLIALTRSNSEAGSSVAVYDVTNPARPLLRTRFDFSGRLEFTRAVEGQVLFVTTTNFYNPVPYVVPTNWSDRASVDEANRKNAVLATDASRFLPAVVVDGQRTAVECTNVFLPTGSVTSGIMSGLFRLDLNNANVRPQVLTAVFANSASYPGVVTASTFVMAVQTLERWGPDLRDRYSSANTQLLQFNWRSAGELQAFGAVPGTILDQFGLDVYSDDVRVATTATWSSGAADERESAVYVLRRSGAELVEMGHVSGLGLTETLRSARFMGNFAYVVTFRRTDPLYTIDLRNPKKPRIAGELKVSGYSDYLHPIGSGRLLGIGQEADPDTGWITGAKAALYDVSNMARPRQLRAVRVASSPFDPDSTSPTSSEAEIDWHAFLWWPTGPTSGKALIPVSTGEDWYSRGFEIAVLKVKGNSLVLQTTIRHPIGPNETSYSSPIRRSLVVNGEFVTVSRSGVKINELESARALVWIPTN